MLVPLDKRHFEFVLRRRPFGKGGGPGGIGEFRDALLLWVTLESLGIYRKIDGQRGVVRAKGMKNFSWSVNFKRWLGTLTGN